MARGARTYDPETQIVIIWSIQDVRMIRPDLDEEQCMEVLSMAERKHDANIGISWDVLDAHADVMFPKQ